MNYGLIFLTGLTSGGISCAAIQGGLLAAAIANQPSRKPHLQVGSFLLAKLLIHTLVGFILGYIGLAFQPNLSILLIFQCLTALYLMASALNLLDVHPIFRHVIIQPPKFLFKIFKRTSGLSDWFAPAALGFLTIFVPCGVTQAMEVTSMSSGSPLAGALTMFSFTLGTMPLFIVIGLTTATLSKIWQRRLNYLSAGLIMLLSLSSLNGVLTVLDSPFSVTGLINTYKLVRAYETGKVASATSVGTITNGIQKVHIDITSSGYVPNYIQVKKDIPVELTLTTRDNYTCANYFVFSAFNISARLQPSETRTFAFIPNKTGKFNFSCSMGMYSGVMEVVES